MGMGTGDGGRGVRWKLFAAFLDGHLLDGH